MADHEDYLPGEAPMAHHESHESLGSDEISVAGLAGESAALAAHKLLPTVHQDAPGLIETHRLVADAHHSKYTDVEARSALYSSLPSFHAYIDTFQANVTGDGTTWPLTGAIWTELLDNLGNFVNGVFTAPIEGLYLFTAHIRLTGLAAAHTLGYLSLVTTRFTYLVNYLNMGAIQSGGYLYFTTSLLVDLSVDDTAFLRIVVSNGAKAVDVHHSTYLSGALIHR